MQRSNLVKIGWPLLKSEFAIKPLKMSYTQSGASYQVYAVSPSYGLWAIVVDPAEVADFEANYKADAIVVQSLEEAAAISILPQVSSSVLNSQDSGRSFGYLGTSSTALVPVRATTYTPPGNNAQRSVVSTDPADAPGGTGARRVRITYLNAGGNGPLTETVILNGTTPVNTVAVNIAFIEKIEVVRVGSLGVNAGDIQLWTGLNGGGSVIGTIKAGDNQTYWAHHYVPVGKKSSIMCIDVSSSVVPGGIILNALNPVNDSIPNKALDATIRHGITHIHKPYIVPVPVDGPALLFLTEKPDDVTPSTVFAGFAWLQI